MFQSSVLSLVLVVLLSANGLQAERLEPYFSHENPSNDEEPQPSTGKEGWNPFGHPSNKPYSDQDRPYFKPSQDKPGFRPNRDRHDSEVSSALAVAPFNTELFYRLDIVPCPNTYPPGPNQTRVYETWIIFSSSRGFRCWSKHVSTTPIQREQDGGNSIYVVRSENYGSAPYYPRRVQYFNIQCPDMGYVHNMTTDLERRVKLTIGNTSTYYCPDYVKIVYNNQGVCELCANDTYSTNGCTQFFSNGISITFRSSRLNNFKGFSMKVVCMNANEQDLPGCIQTLPAREEKSTSAQEDGRDYHSTIQKFVPENAEEELLNFYEHYIESPHTLSVEDHYKILRLAVLSENSCSAVLRSIGREVAKMFPAVMVMQAKINELGWEYV